MQQLTVREGTAAYQAWVETPIPMYTKFYFFDMLNPRDLFHKHEKPILEERGPYTFRWGRSRRYMNSKIEALSDNELKSTAKRQQIQEAWFKIITFFRETQKKVDLQWHPNGTVTYRRVKYWYFERSLSVGDLSDVVTTINVPVVGSAEFVRGSFFMEWGISDMLATLEATIFVR